MERQVTVSEAQAPQAPQGPAGRRQGGGRLPGDGDDGHLDKQRRMGDYLSFFESDVIAHLVLLRVRQLRDIHVCPSLPTLPTSNPPVELQQTAVIHNHERGARIDQTQSKSGTWARKLQRPSRKYSHSAHSNNTQNSQDASTSNLHPRRRSSLRYNVFRAHCRCNGIGPPPGHTQAHRHKHKAFFRRLLVGAVRS